MHDQYLLWQYRDDNNCWDFVRHVLSKEFNVPAAAIPKFGICPSDKLSMTNAFYDVKQKFKKITQPLHGAVACHFMGSVLIHVGVVLGDKVYHASSRNGTRKDTIKHFTRTAKTRFFLWQN